MYYYFSGTEGCEYGEMNPESFDAFDISVGPNEYTSPINTNAPVEITKTSPLNIGVTPKDQSPVYVEEATVSGTPDTPKGTIVTVEIIITPGQEVNCLYGFLLHAYIHI